MKSLIPGHLFLPPAQHTGTPTADHLLPVPQPNIVVPRTLTAWGQYVAGHSPLPSQMPGNTPKGIVSVLARKMNPLHPNHDIRPLKWRIRLGWERVWNTAQITYRRD